MWGWKTQIHNPLYTTETKTTPKSFEHIWWHILTWINLSYSTGHKQNYQCVQLPRLPRVLHHNIHTPQVLHCLWKIQKHTRPRESTVVQAVHGFNTLSLWWGGDSQTPSVCVGAVPLKHYFIKSFHGIHHLHSYFASKETKIEREKEAFHPRVWKSERRIGVFKNQNLKPGCWRHCLPGRSDALANVYKLCALHTTEINFSLFWRCPDSVMVLLLGKGLPAVW